MNRICLPVAQVPTRRHIPIVRGGAAVLLLGLLASGAAMATDLSIAGTCGGPMTAPPSCAKSACTEQELGGPGNAIEPKTGRRFFLDYPCEWKPGEPLNFILSLHGASLSGAFQRFYFPAFRYVEKYHLVIATPTAAGGSPMRMWIAAADDQYLENIVKEVFRRFGRKNIRSFWIAGHSQGGITANRLVCNAFFKDKVDGWLSLSGGRIGPVQLAPDFFGPHGPPRSLTAAGRKGPRPGVGELPTCDISYIFESGEREITGLPRQSPLAERYGCGARVHREDVIDVDAGYVTGAMPGRPASWGREARPGTARVFVYPNCRGGRLVADVLRLDKGHTEGLEPRITEELIRLMLAAPGAKAQASR